MPPTDASTDAGTASVPAFAAPDRDTGSGSGAAADPGPRSGADCEDTLDLRLPYAFMALCTEEEAGRSATGHTVAAGQNRAVSPAPVAGRRGAVSPTPVMGANGATRRTAAMDPAEAGPARSAYPADVASPAPSEHPAVAAPAGLTHRAGPALVPSAHRAGATGDRAAPPAILECDDLLDDIAEWGTTTTPAGMFRLLPVRLGRDLPLVARWMNDPAVAAFWDLAGPESVAERHLRAQLEGDGRSVPCLGVLDGTPMSYWEIYRADLDPLARHYPSRPHDTGIHVLVGGVADRGRGLGSTLLRAVADLVLDHRPTCARVVAEPDLRNTPSVSAFLSAGFRFAAEVGLPDKRAALMVRDRVLRHLL